MLDQFLSLQPLLAVAFATTLSKRLLSVAVSMHSGLPQGTLPLCLKVKLKCLCSAHRETS